jgi:hypothetical protein
MVSLSSSPFSFVYPLRGILSICFITKMEKESRYVVTLFLCVPFTRNSLHLFYYKNGDRVKIRGHPFPLCTLYEEFSPFVLLQKWRQSQDTWSPFSFVYPLRGILSICFITKIEKESRYLVTLFLCVPFMRNSLHLFYYKNRERVKIPCHPFPLCTLNEEFSPFVLLQKW